MEGPSLVILKEEAQPFVGKEIIAASGSNKMDKNRITGQKINSLKTWGKHFLIVLDDCSIRIHYLMFGNYYINSKHPEKIPKLSFEFENGEWNNYNCAAKIIEETDLDTLYDWTTDVMNESWDATAAKSKLKAKPAMMVCDALLDQSIFSGVGNIIKNEVLFRIQLHPESQVGALPTKKLNELIKEAAHYSFQFFSWKKEGVLRKNWLAHTKKICTRCNLPFTKKHTGVTPRRSFFCTQCQELYLVNE
ncbi:MAG TPA: DNA-formamidopyrimidine glycosylase family protein [Chitinophagaceae bacterium]|nr:DNA-formamidopyrimidine glycosylase family protein [Chitinophagaceae bacterium]